MLTVSTTAPPQLEGLKQSRWSLGRLTTRLGGGRPSTASESNSAKVKQRRIHTPPEPASAAEVEWQSRPSREALRHALRQIRDEDNGAFVQISGRSSDEGCAPDDIHDDGWQQSSAAMYAPSMSTASSSSVSDGRMSCASSSRSGGVKLESSNDATWESSAGGSGRLQQQAHSPTALTPALYLRPSPVFQDMPLQALKNFETIDTLGTGTFGRVLLVRLRSRARTDPQAYFALKVLNKQDVIRLRQVAHTNNERYVLSRVYHPFVVNLFCTYQDSENCYMLMEYVVGGEIFSHLRRARRFTVDQTRFYIACLVLALAHLHAHKILYRDLKPENLLLDRHGYVKLTDFGFAKELGGQERTWTLCGTPEYLSPEVIQSQGQTFATDYWALGVLMYEMLCGFPPFYDSTPFATYEKILHAPLTFPKHVDPPSRHLITSLLTRDVSKRLGNLRGGASDVMSHPWFHGVDWSALLRKEIVAPIVPRQSFAGDTCNFEKYDTNLQSTAMPALNDERSTSHYDPLTDHLFIDF